MVTGEFNISKRTILQSFMKIYGRGRSAQSSSHTDSRTSRSNGDSYHAKASSRLVKTVQVSRNVFKWAEFTLNRNKTFFLFPCIFIFSHQSRNFIDRSFMIKLIRSRGNVVGIATGYELDDRKIRVRVPVGSRILSS
jgi:hypothetical protein